MRVPLVSLVAGRVLYFSAGHCSQTQSPRHCLNVYILQGSVATRLRCGRNLCICFAGNFSFPEVKEI